MPGTIAKTLLTHKEIVTGPGPDVLPRVISFVAKRTDILTPNGHLEKPVAYDRTWGFHIPALLARTVFDCEALNLISRLSVALTMRCRVARVRRNAPDLAAPRKR